MCCIVTLALVLGSRIAIFVWWLLDRTLFNSAFGNWVLPGGVNIPSWLWALLGGIFIPWTTLAYLYVFPNGIVGLDWVILGIGVLIDLASHGGSYRNRSRIYRRSQAL